MPNDQIPPADDASAVTRRLWGQAPLRRRGPKPTLTLPAIVEATLELADREGLAAVSMARIAEALNCTPMALYRHIESKDELLSLLVDRVAGDAPPLLTGLGWRDGLRAWARAQIDGVLAHPWLLQLPLASTALGPNRARCIDQGLGVMQHFNLPMADKGQIINLLSLYILAEARVQVELRNRAINPFAELAQHIHQLTDTKELPHLFEALTDNSTSEGSDAFEIDIILDGIAARVSQTSKRRPRSFS